MKNYFFVFTILLFITTSCNKKETFIKDFESFIADVELMSKDYNEKDWTTMDETFKDYSEIQFQEQRDSMTPEEITKVNELIGKYNAIKVKQEINNITRGLEDGLEQVKGLLKEFLPDSNQIKKLKEKADSY